MPDLTLNQNHKPGSLLKSSAYHFAPIFLIFSIFFLLVKIYELSFGIYNNTVAAPGSILLISFIKDLSYMGTIFLWCYIVFLFFWWINKKVAVIITTTILCILLFIEFFLIKYFLVSLVPLGADFWAYSWKDIQHTIAASGAVQMSSLFSIIIFIAFLFFGFKYLSKKIHPGSRTVLFFLAASAFFNVFGINKKIVQLNFTKQEFSNNLSENKSFYFFSKSREFFFSRGDDANINTNKYSDDAAIASTFSLVDEAHYPFLHQEEAQDVLGAFFDTTATQSPNIVFIIAEGLGRAFSNKGAYWGSFTPFLDSLSEKSLYWENCLSQGGRTFAVLPAVLGSLPFGKNGFLDIGEKLPNHFSLINLLQQQNYTTGFYYGGDASFDGMAKFLQKNNINNIIDEKEFSSAHEKMPTDENGFSWGYGDKELFKKYFDTKPNLDKPYVNLLLTVSTHNPFKVNNQDYYLQRFQERMSQLNFTEKEKQDHLNYKYQGASILFLDDAIRDFFSAYEKRNDYANTVFIITGDHRMPEIPISTKIDRYHVPLIIFSPLLKRATKFSSVVSHNDITPSILAWLQQQYKISQPQQTAWLSHGLDTNRSFRNRQPIAFMQTKNGISDFASDNFFLSEKNDLFTFDASMNLEKSDDNVMEEKLKMQLEKFIQKNSQVAVTGTLMPDSLFRKYIKK
jgi:phosphoglycerol transferase MdoB-like AlkP superfamily enzyme